MTTQMKSAQHTWTADYGLYAIFGYPLTHTYSPKMHNEAFKALGLDNYYIDIPIPPHRFSRLVRSLKKSPLSGFNLTVPHKELILKALDVLDPEAKKIGAVNTVLARTVKNGKHPKVRFVGYNTDAYGFREALRRVARFNVRGKSVLVLGAGGAARACVYALAKDGAGRIVVANRTVSKAERLIKHISKSMGLDKKKLTAVSLRGGNLGRLLSDVRLVVNSTSLGLRPADPVPLHLRLLPKRKDILIFDLIYNPSRTKLLLEASKRGYRTLNGLPMLLYQGARSFEIWTGRSAPIHVMRKALKEAGS